GLAWAAVAARTVIEAVAHLLGLQRLAAMVAHDRWIEIPPAAGVLEKQRRFAAREPVVAPAQHRDQRAVEVLALVGERIFVALGQVLILAADENAFGDEPVEPVGENVRRDAEFGLQVVETAHAEER